MVRQRVLVPSFAGSIPAIPAIFMPLFTDVAEDCRSAVVIIKYTISDNGVGIAVAGVSSDEFSSRFFDCYGHVTIRKGLYHYIAFA